MIVVAFGKVIFSTNLFELQKTHYEGTKLKTLLWALYLFY